MPDASTPPTAWSFDDVYGVPNLDDDDGSTIDWDQDPFAGDNELSSWTLSGEVLDALEPGQQVELAITSGGQEVRVYRDGALVLGGGAGPYSFEPPGGDVELTVEFGDYFATATVTLSALDGASEIASDEVLLRAAPVIMNHHLQEAEQVYAVRVNDPSYDNAAFIDAYASVLGSDLTEVYGPSYGWDVWIQDEFTFGTLTGAEGQRVDIVIDSIRDRGLDDYPEDAHLGPDKIVDTWGNPWDATTYDSFGNLEVSPPVTAGGVEYPFGRIYYGAQGPSGLDDALADFLASQSVQEPFELPTSWLCVGHVDEYSTFVPAPSSPKGFVLLLSDVPSAWDLLEDMPADTQLPRYAADHGYSTVGDLLADESLVALNNDLQTDYLDPIRQTFKDELGLTDADIVEIPSLFEIVGGCGGRVAALVPGLVNLTVANVDGQTTHLFMPDPFFRSNEGDLSSDPFIKAFSDAVPQELDLHWVDNWDVYHMGLGEVHCGTNVKRTPSGDWWTDAQHLLGGN